ncbi:MAG: hypothetical protein B5766_02950 [Candidatus Lumbricidophila eiseniae]|uniref:ABC transporter domain-containing protein n=1 Tax=Candidatus Lumbricidiphila eiseniae TaxID=1969409 RepID=A0A2A6FTR4_9MICO|nr:MAG: hypothetical protein B5766_02950 [Candidatus Lumbricidophila eiseniae]
MVADEPMASLDSANADGVLALMHRLNEESGTTIIVSSDDERVIAAGRRVVHLVDGAMASESAEGLTFRCLVHMALAMIRTNPRTVRTFPSVAIATFGLLLSLAAINAVGTMMAQSAHDIISGDVSGFAEGYDYSMLNQQSDVVHYLEGGQKLPSKLKASPGVATVRPRITAGAQLSTGTHDSGVVIVGSDVRGEGYQLLDGFAPSGAGEICVNAEQHDERDLVVGDKVTLAVAGAPVANAITEARVVCVYDSSRFGLFRSSFVVMDVAGMQRILD